MATLEWRFKTYLDQHGITPYRLHKALHGQVSQRLTYDWAKERPERLHLPVLEKVMSALESITGESVEVADLIKFIPDPEPLEEVDAETRAWLDAEPAPPLEPYDWGDVDPETLGQGRVEYVQGKGWIVTGEQTE